jgi:hypothetical protein
MQASMRLRNPVTAGGGQCDWRLAGAASPPSEPRVAQINSRLAGRNKSNRTRWTTPDPNGERAREGAALWL